MFNTFKMCVSRSVRYLAVFAVFMAAAFLCGGAMAASKVNFGELKPDMANASYLGEYSKCAMCHEPYVEKFKKTKHAGAMLTSNDGKSMGGNCGACHGPASKHADEPSKVRIIDFKKDSTLTPAQKNSVCLQCHENGIRTHWSGSKHEMAGLSCNECHYVMERRSDKSLFINEDPKAACFKCHPQRRAGTQRSTHMPLKEGAMDCASCHNPHGGSGPSMLKTASVNETCYACHAEKRGPLLFEHPPVRELCTNCHDPHGTNSENLLKKKVPQLCQSCHNVQFHPSTLYNGYSAAPVTAPATTIAQQVVGKGCLNCHSQIHGSNHPSGARYQR